MLNDLKVLVAGKVITEEDAAYATYKDGYFVTGNPLAIVLCEHPEDVAAVIQFATNNQLPLSVRSGGHSTAGYGTNEQGIVVDLQPMSTVTLLDTQQNIVRIGGGAKWGAVAKALQPYGLAISSGDSADVGVGGIITGGGMGWMVRKFGLTIDSIIGMDVVLADGQLVRASADEHADLFMAIRGGGSNFGVVTSFDIIAQPVKEVLFGTVTVQGDDLASMLTLWRDYLRASSDELTSIVKLVSAEPGKYVLDMLLCHSGDEAVATRETEPFLALPGTQKHTLQRMPYAGVLMESPKPPAGLVFDVDAGFFPELSDDAIKALALFADTKPGMLELRYLGRGIAQEHNGKTAFGYRDVEVLVVWVYIFPEDLPEAEKQQAIRPGLQLREHTQGSYLNFPSDPHYPLERVYPQPLLAELQRIKSQYDPQNIFNSNLNIQHQLDGVATT
jgi:FAD/FMN-containing dehydrogenase